MSNHDSRIKVLLVGLNQEWKIHQISAAASSRIELAMGESFLETQEDARIKFKQSENEINLIVPNGESL